MEIQQKINRLLSISTKKDIADKLQQKLSGKQDFIAIHPLEPSVRFNYLQALQYVAASRAVTECGGKYILFISDIKAQQNLAFNLNDELIQTASNYAVAILKELGVCGPNIEIVKSSELSLNAEMFFDMVQNSIKVSVQDVQNTLQVPKNSKEVQTASKYISPCLQATEMIHLKADIVITTVSSEAQFSLIEKFSPDNVPVIIPMLDILNLKPNQPRLDLNNNFYVEDDLAVLKKKANSAFCTDDISNNPIFISLALLIEANGEFVLGEKKYNDVEAATADFAAMDKKSLKEAIANAIFIATQKVAETVKGNEELTKISGEMIASMNPKKAVPPKKTKKQNPKQQKPQQNK
ncbi:tyrosyl-tRNA synthetase [Histomonas meleagridis]|uniref:tyrosyl-tRNA synthetase n=1 Tax=Histomonas meleagridis TaxID=135588 RepID=UPI00355A4490|nr:tyrosyl-tRNA synthetase [Histomonas meleagridis]KAH0801434.1 tyrosyl-tRNA synthetase [Histomonas meleagridis]